MVLAGHLPPRHRRTDHRHGPQIRRQHSQSLWRLNLHHSLQPRQRVPVRLQDYVLLHCRMSARHCCNADVQLWCDAAKAVQIVASRGARAFEAVRRLPIFIRCFYRYSVCFGIYI